MRTDPSLYIDYLHNSYTSDSVSLRGADPGFLEIFKGVNLYKGVGVAVFISFFFLNFP